jgi:hypothetical protein
MFYLMVEALGCGKEGFFGCGLMLTMCEIERSHKGNKAVRLQKSNSALTCRQRIYGARICKRGVYSEELIPPGGPVREKGLSCLPARLGIDLQGLPKRFTNTGSAERREARLSLLLIEGGQTG